MKGVGTLGWTNLISKLSLCVYMFLSFFFWQILCAFDILVCHDEIVKVGMHVLFQILDFW